MNDSSTIDITSVAHGGHGVGRIDGRVCFVPAGLPGDRLRVRLRKEEKSFSWADIEEVLEPSPDRLESVGARAAPSGGSTWLHFAYPAQADWKCQIIRDAFERIAGLSPDLEWIEDPRWRTGYRTRAQFHGDGRRLGFYAPGTHDIQDTGPCPLCHDRLNEAFLALRDVGIKGNATVTVNPEGEEVLVWTKFARRKLRAQFPLANTPKDDKPRAQFLFDGVPIVNGTFAQASLLLNRLLVHITHEMVGKPSSLLDLYCGSGNLSLGLAEKTRVVGMDQNRHAIKAAARLHRGEYRRGGEAAMAKLIDQGEWDTIVLDPPRTGAKALMPHLGPSSARAIVYVSCDPATLARDVKALAAHGWQVTQCAALDLFPNTPHVETVCRLER